MKEVMRIVLAPGKHRVTFEKTRYVFLGNSPPKDHKDCMIVYGGQELTFRSKDGVTLYAYRLGT